jgi:hypothetical protein
MTNIKNILKIRRASEDLDERNVWASERALA